jgi:hypothetical protein
VFDAGLGLVHHGSELGNFGPDQVSNGDWALATSE